MSPLGEIDVPALLLGLDRYPVGCSEQIVSRALPLLYVDKLAPPQDLALDGDLHPRLAGAIAKLLGRQRPRAASASGRPRAAPETPGSTPM